MVDRYVERTPESGPRAESIVSTRSAPARVTMMLRSQLGRDRDSTLIFAILPSVSKVRE